MYSQEAIPVHLCVRKVEIEKIYNFLLAKKTFMEKGIPRYGIALFSFAICSKLDD